MQTTVGASLFERRKSSSLNLILNVVVIVFVIVFAVELLFNSYFTSIYVTGSSMMPTLTGAATDITGRNVLSGGDYVFVDTHKTPAYSDIVVVRTADEGGRYYNIIKRVVAFGGDTVKIENGQLSIKYAGDDEFVEINEQYLSSDVVYNDPYDPVNTYKEHVVAENCMFLLGDNRNKSADSRARDDFPLSDLVGVVPDWAIEHKGAITSIYTFFEFTLGFNKLKNNYYGE